MKQIVLFSTIFITFSTLFAQNDEFSDSFIKRMSWGTNYKIELTLRNDSVYVVDMQNIQHTKGNPSAPSEEFTYYPVSLNTEFVEKLKQKGVDLGLDTIESASDTNFKLTELSVDRTLWSALHTYIGGGWIHFVNTMLFTIEGGYLNIRSPLLQRPNSNWKPNPMTESYKRTHKWKYFTPVTQKEAIKEYKIKQKKGELGHLQYLPQKFIDLFLNTSDAELKKMIENGDRKSVARLDLIKVLLGSNYLGKSQIRYMKSSVLRSVMNFSRNKLPSVIIFDDYNAAVALTLDETGYHIESMVFNDEDKVSLDDIHIRRKTIEQIITNINEVNMELFRDKLKKYYN